MNGELINIDGSGNRVSSMFYEPKKVIIVCGINKIVENYETGIERIKNTACPQNARRLKLDTPCAKTGKCSDCSSPHRMCNVVVKLEPGKRYIFLSLESQWDFDIKKPPDFMVSNPAAPLKYRRKENYAIGRNSMVFSFLLRFFRLNNKLYSIKRENLFKDSLL